MKKVAAIFLLIFALAQFAPAVACWNGKDTAILMVDEEKGNEKSEKKDKKEFSSGLSADQLCSLLILSKFDYDVKLYASPFAEMPAPPPDFK